MSALPDVAALSRQALLFLARQEQLKDAAVQLAPLQQLAERFVAGTLRSDAIAAALALAEQGCAATFDHLEESVRSVPGTRAEVEEYEALLAEIAAARLPERLGAHVSVKLSQCGLEIDPAVAVENLRRIVLAAQARGSFVRVDMEGSALTSATLDAVRAVRAEFPESAVGVAVQAYLRRTEDDVRSLATLPVRIRLCKGAYLEPPDRAFPLKRDVDENYLRLMRTLLDSGTPHALATHDPRMIDAAREHAARNGIPRTAFEFQLLYGIRRDLQRELAAEGYRVRVYVPYGRAWYPYFMRRLAERPANVWFMLKNLVH